MSAPKAFMIHFLHFLKQSSIGKLTWTFLFIFTSIAPSFTQDKIEFFEKHIRPVLIENCYECHNSHDKQKGGLNLDHRAAMMAGGDTGPAIVPGKPDDSLLITTIRHEEEDMEMPFKAPKLDDATIAHFETWVKMGAPDPRDKAPETLITSLPWETTRDKRAEWWSFQPVASPTPPKQVPSSWKKNNIDAFVYSKLKEEGLKPENSADKHTLLRRVHLILKGTPPTTEDIEAFMSDTSPNAYEKVVDQLLAAESFGLRWARHWMDWYRYAESHGSEGDPRIPEAQAYRDYLIRALNQDIPYDQLLVEHIAGDLISKPRFNKQEGFNESAIGTAQYRMVPHGFGVTDAYDELITFTDNQIDVISKATMGLTVSCARCHDHKFDPISQKDFYRFFGMMISNRHSQIVVNTEEQLNAHKNELHKLKLDIKKDLIAHWKSQSKNIVQNLNQLPSYQKNLKAVDPKKRNEPKQIHTFTPEGLNLRINQIYRESHPLAAFLMLRDLKGEAFNKQLDLHRRRVEDTKSFNQKIRKSAHKIYDFRTEAGLKEWFLEGNGSFNSTLPKVSKAGEFALSHDGEDIIQGVYPRGVYSHLLSDKHYLHLSSKYFKIKGNGIYFKIIGGNQAGARYSVRNYPLTHGGLHPNFGGRDIHWTQHNMQWSQLAKFPYWQGDQAHIEISTAGDATFTPNLNKSKRSWIGISEIIMADQHPRQEGASFFEFTSKKITPENLGASYAELTLSMLNKWKQNKLNDREAFFLSAMIQNQILPNKITSLPESIQNKIKAYRALESKVIVPKRVPGLREGQIVDAPLLDRGSYREERENVPRGFLEVFSEKKYSAKTSGRLELAQDIASKDNPLTARLLINRLWGLCFGQGIVSTPNNFGRLGKTPTHPELLDYMTTKFINENWSIKKALRHMVTSNTFKLSSKTGSSNLEQDPSNKYYSYFSARRLDAEGIRDTLFSIGNPNVQRSIYLPVIRNRLHPFLTAFDAPIPMSTVSHRLRTNVPAQALTMMNGLENIIPTKIRHKLDHRLSDQDKIKKLFLMVYSRPATEAELNLSYKILKETNIDFLINSLIKTKEVIFVR